MIAMQRLAMLVVGTIALAACGQGSDGATGAADAAPSDSGPLVLDDAGVPVGWEPLIGVDWQLPAGTEEYYCATVILDHDVAIGGFAPIAPLGTHHTVLMAGVTGFPEGPCDGTALVSQWLYASGIGTPPLELPPDTGMVLTAGTPVNIQLHLFNTLDGPLSGHSGVAVKPLAQAPAHSVDLVLPGTMNIDIPAGQTGSATGRCPIDAPTRYFALFPHMHRHGRHMRVEHWRSGALAEVMWDDDFDFEDQRVARVGPFDLTPGDEVRTTCTWDNTDGLSALGWGESSSAEMCFAIFYRTPADGSGFGWPFCGN